MADFYLIKLQDHSGSITWDVFQLDDVNTDKPNKRWNEFKNKGMTVTYFEATEILANRRTQNNKLRT